MKRIALFAKLATQIGRALKDPVWGIWLGRKACIPTKPVFAGIFGSERDIEEKLLSGHSISEFCRVEDAGVFDQGKNSIPDVPVSFDISERNYLTRRVMVYRVDHP